MTRDDLIQFQEDLYLSLSALLQQGQAEYAGGESAFGNFERLADQLGIEKEKVLWTYAMKHADGIASWLRGHKSQREDVRGRIQDMIVYLTILHAMVDHADPQARS